MIAIAYACILVAALLPYIWTALAKSGGEQYDNRDPRAWVATQRNPRMQRAYAAHLNAFEAFAPFAASVLMAQFAGVGPAWIALAAVAFVVLRVLHGVFYVTDFPALRSLSWLGGISCVVGLMVAAIVAA